MTDRYDAPLEIITSNLGKQVYKTARPTYVNQTINSITITANEQSRLDVLASNVYGDAQQWWQIASVNGNVNGSLHMTPGNTIIIPTE